MIRKLAALAVVALSMVVVPLTSQAHAETYGPKLPTSVSITFVNAGAGQPLKIKLAVAASDGSSPAGDLAYSIDRTAGTEAAVGSSNGSVAVSGHAATVVGPVARAGGYRISAHFTPTDTSKYLPSSKTAGTTVRGVEGESSGNPGGGVSGRSGSGLPNTGGPALGWLIAGLALALGGAGAIAVSRRTPSAA